MMSTQNLKIDDAFSICENLINRIDRNDAKAYEAEYYITAALVVLIVSEFESAVHSAFTERARKCSDAPVASYAISAMHRKFLTPNTNKIKDALVKFKIEYSGSFDVESDDAVVAWNSIMTNRHAYVHKAGSFNLTFQELKSKYTDAIEVVARLESLLQKS